MPVKKIRVSIDHNLKSRPGRNRIWFGKSKPPFNFVRVVYDPLTYTLELYEGTESDGGRISVIGKPKNQYYMSILPVSYYPELFQPGEYVKMNDNKYILLAMIK